MKFTRIDSLFWELLPNSYFLSLVLGAVTGLANALLVPLIMYSLSGDVSADLGGRQYTFFDSPSAELAWVFVLTCLSIVVLRGISSTLTTYVAKTAAMEHRRWLYGRVLKMRLADVERIGQARLFNVLYIDIPAIISAGINFPQIWISGITIAGMLVYLAHLNSRVFWFIVACVVLAIIVYQLPLIVATKYIRRARERYDQVQEGVTGLICGLKELKLNATKSREYFNNALMVPEKFARDDNVKGDAILIFAQGYGDVIAFLVSSIVIFHFRYSFSLSSQEMLGIVMGLMYISAPVANIMSTIGMLRHGKVSLRNLQSFYKEVSVEVESEEGEGIPAWDTVHVCGLCYSYGGLEATFSLTDINLSFRRGQISFVIGSNGSGKSTLGKCLSFLYLPSDGYICLGVTKIDSKNLVSAREFVSAIFPDYYIFKKLYAQASRSLQAKITQYLEYLELDHKVSVADDQFSTINLSEGQRKRLALVVMLIEDRDILIFDEWAADQDPGFKQIFYARILPDLKLRNKVIIVISHDDRYFEYADQVIIMEDGRVVGDMRDPDKDRPRLAVAAAVS